MLRRLIVVALAAAVLVVLGGVAAWRYHVVSVEAQLDRQAENARGLLAEGAQGRDPASILAAVAGTQLDAFLHDRMTGAAYVWIDGQMRTPRSGAFGPVPMPPAPMPPELVPMPMMPMHRAHFDRSAVTSAIAELAHVRPRRIDVDGFVLLLVPSGAALMRWLGFDLMACIAALVAIGLSAWAIGAALARAARETLLDTTLALEALAAGNFTPQTVKPGQAHELARLANAYNAAAETVARSIEERRAAAEEFQRFLADAGHELRTPLTIVGGYVDILRRSNGIDDVTMRRVLGGMSTEMERMRGLVEKMLLLSRLESTAIEPKVVAVADVAREVVEAMQPAFPERQIVVNCDAGARLLVDEDDLYEALRNAVENALRYAPDSPVTVNARTRDGVVAIEVADRGPGIPAEERMHVFERFYRGKESTAQFEGSGLGLAIVQRVVERWHGSVALDSGESGTRVTMEFPSA